MVRTIWTVVSALIWLLGAIGVYGASPLPTMVQGNGVAPPALLAAAVCLIGVVGVCVQLRNATFRYLELKRRGIVLGVRYVSLGLVVLSLWMANTQYATFLSHVTYPATQYLLPFYFTSLPVALTVLLLSIAAGTVWDW